MKGKASFRASFFCVFLMVFSIINFNGCQKNSEMVPASTLRDVIDGIKSKTEYMVFGGDGGPTMLIVPSIGARVMGASVDGLGGKNLFWINPEVYTDEFWQNGPGWNGGGYRSWIAPEDAFYLDKEDNWFVPESMDPGSYKLVNSTSQMAVFTNEFKVENRKGEEYHLKLTRELHLLETYQWPEVGPLPADVHYVGIRMVHSLENMGDKVIGEDVPHVGLWSLLMVEPSGTMIIPLTKPGGKNEAYRDYFNPLPPERISVHERAITVKIDGKYRSKIGIHPEYAGAGIAFLAEDEGGQGRLYVKQFMVNPNGVYLDHPWGKPSDYGDAVQMYNDDGKMGGFTELECHGPAQKLAPGEKESHDIHVHILKGPVETLKNLGSQVLELDFSELTFYK